MHKHKLLLDCRTMYYFSHSLFSTDTTVVCTHKIQYFSINWRLSGVASRDLQSGGGGGRACQRLTSLWSATRTVYYYVFEWFDVFIMHHCNTGVKFAVVKFMETITSQLYRALTHAMRIIPWLWTTTPLRGSWKITSLQSAQVQAPTSASRTRCPRSPSVHRELHFPNSNA